MHTVRPSDDDHVWTVGYFNPNGHWYPLVDYAEFNEAAAIVSWLNGGLMPELVVKLMDSLKIGGGLNK